MKRIIAVVMIIIVGIISSKLQGCTTIQKDVEYRSDEVQTVIPTATRPLVLLDYEPSVIAFEGSQYTCVNMKDFDKYSYNSIEVERYVKQLKEENKSLRKLIEVKDQ